MAILRAAHRDPDVDLDGTALGEALGELNSDLDDAVRSAALDMKAMANHWEQR